MAGSVKSATGSCACRVYDGILPCRAHSGRWSGGLPPRLGRRPDCGLRPRPGGWEKRAKSVPAGRICAPTVQRQTALDVALARHCCSLRVTRFANNARARVHMPRRKQFRGICHDILDSFVSRNNDLDGYWALGQYAAFLMTRGADQLVFHLQGGSTVPEDAGFAISAKYYRGAISKLMDANAMPRSWLADAYITFSMMGPSKALCSVEIASDVGRTYRSDCTVDARPHDALSEYRREGRSGPSNERGR